MCRILVAALALIGISEPLGSMLHLPSLRALGRITSASNSPLVFNQVEGIEFWANEYSFELRSRDGSVQDLPVTNDVLSRIRGPHTRTAAYVVPIGLGAIYGPNLFLAPLRYGLCGRGPLARDLRIDTDLESAVIHIRSGSPGDDRAWALRVPCPT